MHAIEVDTSLPARKVMVVLERVGNTWGFPEIIICDSGPEFISIELDKWCYKHGIKLHFITPGKPTENCFIESFNGKFRDECLNMNWFTSLFDTKSKIEKWRLEYNTIRPHSSLNNLSPNEFRYKFEKENKTAEPLIASG
jgi:putative transposase